LQIEDYEKMLSDLNEDHSKFEQELNKLLLRQSDMKEKLSRPQYEGDLDIQIELDITTNRIEEIKSQLLYSN
jgi:hypothetical protein